MGRSGNALVAAIAAAAAMIAAGLHGENAPSGGIAPDGMSFDAGFIHRMRQETSHNVPGNPGGGPDVNNRNIRVPGTHLMRFETYVWLRADAGPFTLYGRAANMMREYFRTNGKRRKDRAWTEPDEIVLDNLYLGGKGIFDGFLDFRLGRQDLAEGGKSVFGLDRILFDGTPVDYARTFYADMARFTLHPADDSTLDIFGLYCGDENPISFGRQSVHGRSLNRLTSADKYGPDQWGGGVVWRSKAAGGALPYSIYALHKHDTSYRRRNVHVPEKDISTAGVLLKPELTDSVSLELEGAGQIGRRGDWGAAGGWMGVAGFDWHPKICSDVKTYLKFTGICYSGDKDRSDGHGDKAWDPLWARRDENSIFCRGTYPQISYWTDMFFAKTTIGADFSRRHGAVVYAGPIWAMSDDGVGGGDGRFKGVLGRARYNFPVLLRPENAKGFKRLEIFGSLICEAFCPGDYYASTKPALYARWQLEFVF